MSIKKVDITVLENNASFKILSGKGEKQAVLKPHMVDIDSFLLVQEGEVLFNLDDTKHLLLKGNHIKIPKDTLHSLEVIKDCEFLLTLSSKAKMSFVQ